MMSYREILQNRIKKIEEGGKEKYHQKNEEKGKLFVRKRLELLFDDGLDIEDAFFANCIDESLPSDGGVTGVVEVYVQAACVTADHSTVKARYWGKRTVEKIIRIQERAETLEIPMLYLVDSAGARITDQIEMFLRR